MSKPTHNLKSSKALQRAENPKSGGLSAHVKPSLNRDVEQWVADGGEVIVLKGVEERTLWPKI